MISSFFRSFRIAYVLTRYRIDDVIFSESPHFYLRAIRFFNPFFYWPTRKTRGERLRLALESLGPIFVKFGQVISTRKDLVPKDITDALTCLQDRVKPFRSETAREILKESLKQPIESVFSHFETDPMASASIAQVHEAELINGDHVVVKILRPKIKKKIDQDIYLLMIMAAIMQRIHPRGKRIRPKDIVKEFSINLHNEVDLNREAANATLMKRNFEGNEYVHIPTVYWDHTSRNILVMERISGIPIADQAGLKAQGTDFKKLAETCMELFFTQVFKHNFFHGDMHPGNIFICKENPQRFILVDFGIVGSLAEADRRYIAENMLAFFKRDYHRVAELHVDAGWVDPDTRVFELETAIRSVSEPVFEKPLKDISMGQLLLNLFQIARQFNMNIQPQLVLLQKTLLNIEALGRDLYPDLELWQVAKPFLERWMHEQFGLRAMLKRLKQRLPIIIEKLPEMPELIYDVLEKLAEDPKKA